MHEQQVAKLLIGELQASGPVEYSWHSLDMPWRMHTNPFHEREILKHFGTEKLQWYRDKLALAQT